jgi:hypothetical protein
MAIPKQATLLSSGLAKSFKKGREPQGLFYLVDDKASSVPLIFQQLRNASAELTSLDLYAHGMFVNRYGDGVVGDVAEWIFGHDALEGAYGITLGKDNITRGNLTMFNTLAGCFAAGGTINIYSCSIAATNADREGGPGVWSGNGPYLCQTIADTTGARVRASTSWFYFNHGVDGSDFEPIGFSGAVYVFDAKSPLRRESR